MDQPMRDGVVLAYEESGARVPVVFVHGLTFPSPARMRQSTLKGYAEAASCRNVEVLPIEHDFFRFYRLTAWGRRRDDADPGTRRANA
jgi:hypothetical protein